MCAEDAIQYLTGCTFGQGNMIYKDYGKNAFTFYRRRDGRAIRLIARASIFGDVGQVLSRLHKKLLAEGLTEEEKKTWQETRAKVSKHIMESNLADLFEIKPVLDPAPQKARILASLICQDYGEPTMETRARRFHDQVLCITCFESQEKRH